MAHPKQSVGFCGFSGRAEPEEIDIAWFQTKCDDFRWLQDSVLCLQPMQIQIQWNLNDKGWLGLFNKQEVGVCHHVFGSFAQQGGHSEHSWGNLHRSPVLGDSAWLFLFNYKSFLKLPYGFPVRSNNMAMRSKTRIQIDVTCEAVRYVSLLKRPAGVVLV